MSHSTTGRCIWCNRQDGALTEVVLGKGLQSRRVGVHPEHEALLREWDARARAFELPLVMALAFLPFILIGVFGLAALIAPWLAVPLACVGFVGMAIVIWRHPYATPQTVALLGVQRSIAVARGGALLILALGIGLLAFGVLSRSPTV